MEVINKVYLVVLFCAVLGAVAQILLKQGSAGVNGLAGYLNYNIIGGLFLYVSAMLLYLWVLPKGEVSVLYPILATSYFFVAILSSLFLKEHITLMKAIGSIGIVLSVWVIAR